MLFPLSSTDVDAATSRNVIILFMHLHCCMVARLRGHQNILSGHLSVFIPRALHTMPRKVWYFHVFRIVLSSAHGVQH